MSKQPYFPFYPGDFLSSSTVVLMSPEQRGAYIMLLAHCWQNECKLPDDDHALAQLSGLGQRWFESGSGVGCRSVGALVRTKFQPHPHAPGFLTNDRQYAEWVERQEFLEKSSQAGKKSAEARRAAKEAKLQALKDLKGGSGTSADSLQVNQTATNAQPAGQPTFNQPSTNGQPNGQPNFNSSPSPSPSLIKGDTPLNPRDDVVVEKAIGDGRCPDSYRPEFEDLWLAWRPTKYGTQNKKPAHSAWWSAVRKIRDRDRKAGTARDPVEWLLGRVAAYAASWHATSRFCPYLASWLNAEKFDEPESSWDEIDDGATNGKPGLSFPSDGGAVGELQEILARRGEA